MQTKEEYVSGVYFAYMGAVLFGGVLLGAVGFGAGLLWLTFIKALGLGILTFGCGSIIGATVGGKAILRLMIEAADEVRAKYRRSE